MRARENASPGALREFLRAGAPEAQCHLPAFIEVAKAAFARRAHPGENAARAAEWAFLLAQALGAPRDSASTGQLLLALASAGRMGRTLVLEHLLTRAQPLPQTAAMLQALPGRVLLALVNDMLLDAPPQDKPFTAWLRGLAAAAGKTPRREALVFLRDLRDPLAPALRASLRDAGLDADVTSALAAGPGPATMELLLGAAEKLGGKGCAKAALACALHAAGGGGATRRGQLEPLLAAPPDLPGRDDALLAEMRRLAVSPGAAPALAPAARTEPETLGLVLADMLRDGGATAKTAIRLLPLLPRLGVESCLADLPPRARAVVRARLFGWLAAMDPVFIGRAAETLGATLPPATAAAVATLCAAPSPLRDAAHPAFPASPFHIDQWRRPARPTATGQTGDAAALLAAAQHPSRQLRNPRLAGVVLADAPIEELALTGGTLAGGRFTRVVFRRLRAMGTNMSQSVFQDCVFEECTLTRVDLSGCRLENCRLNGCAFETCDLGRTSFAGGSATDGRLNASNLSGAAVSTMLLADLRLRACAAAGMTLEKVSASRLSATRTDASGGLWRDCRLRGWKWWRCALSRSRFLDCDGAALTLASTPLDEVEVFGGHTDSPDLEQARRATLARLLEGPLADGVALPGALASGPGATFLRESVDAFLRVDEAEATLTAMRGQDARRRELALRRLGERGAFLRLLPALLTTDIFDRACGLANVVVCRFGGPADRAAGHATLAELARLFPTAAPSPASATPAPDATIEAAYAMGSVGSVAQKPDSDLDCWICLAPGERTARAALAAKLTAIERWAGESLGLETHFFLMELEAVRREDFGMSDRESSGSAQAALLKEEFYRTALKLGGRDLLWWATPAAADQTAADVLLRELAALRPRTAAELLNLGQPRPIPEDEYFGACLWQMVKALHSPYKSVLKLALLEKYAGQGDAARLLCDRIKEALARGRRLLSDVDPYLSLFTAARKHYLRLGDTASLELLEECLRLKTDVEPQDLPEEFDAPAAPAGSPGPADRDAGGPTSPLEEAMRLGGLVELFMIRAYQRIQEGLREGRAARITPEDLTRLGRRIAANFSRQPHKVDIVPFFAEDLRFDELSFSAEKTPGRRTVWAVKARDAHAAGKTPVESLPPVRRDVDAAGLLAWLYFNGLYEPGRPVLAQKTIAPMALADLQSLLADMAEFFPRRETLEPDLDEYLRPERMTRCLLLVNLTEAAEQPRIVTVAAIYSTNWGEIFVETFDNPAPALVKSPSAFLRGALAKNMPDSCELRVFTPRRAVCPRLRPI